MITRLISKLKKYGIEADLNELEKILVYNFKNRVLLLQSLKHRSFTARNFEDRIESNERLEFLGDSVLGFIVSRHLYKNFPDISEGELSKIRAMIVSGENLSEKARHLHLGKYILLSESEDKTGGRDKDSILEDTIEAVIGALYLDGGLVQTTKFIKREFLDDLNFMLADKRDSNYKSTLLELVQSRGCDPPVYETVSENGPEHRKTFTVKVIISGKTVAKGSSTSKKRAEQEASSNALEKITEDPDFNL